MINAAVKVASPAHACGIHVYVWKIRILVLPKRIEAKSICIRYGCSDSSKLNMPLEHLFTRQCTAQ